MLSGCLFCHLWTFVDLTSVLEALVRTYRILREKMTRQKRLL